MWRLLREEFEPRAGGRRSAMLVGILDPKWSGDAATFAAEFRKWETAVSSYEDQASSRLYPW